MIKSEFEEIQKLESVTLKFYDAMYSRLVKKATTENFRGWDDKHSIEYLRSELRRHVNTIPLDSQKNLVDIANFACFIWNLLNQRDGDKEIDLIKAPKGVHFTDKSEDIKTEGLKPCPFCGAEEHDTSGYNLRLSNFFYDIRIWNIKCERCGGTILFPSIYSSINDREYAIECWNRRSSSQ